MRAESSCRRSTDLREKLTCEKNRRCDWLLRKRKSGLQRNRKCVTNRDQKKRWLLSSPLAIRRCAHRPRSCLPWRSRSRPGCSTKKARSTSSSRCLIVAVLLLVFEEREHRRIAISLGLAAFVGVWVSLALGGSAGRLLLVGAHLLAACFFASLYGEFSAQSCRNRRRATRFLAPSAATCSWASSGAFCTPRVETASPGSFSMPAPAGAELPAVHIDRGLLGYYSFITLATVGYGDVTPITPLARTLGLDRGRHRPVLPRDPGGGTGGL